MLRSNEFEVRVSRKTSHSSKNRTVFQQVTIWRTERKVDSTSLDYVSKSPAKSIQSGTRIFSATDSAVKVFSIPGPPESRKIMSLPLPLITSSNFEEFEIWEVAMAWISYFCDGGRTRLWNAELLQIMSVGTSTKNSSQSFSFKTYPLRRGEQMMRYSGARDLMVEQVESLLVFKVEFLRE